MADSENCCENCDMVDRSIDEYSHFCYKISERCPLFKIILLFLEINGYPLAMELTTRHTGCRYFKLDEKYKKENNDADKLIAELHKKWGWDKNV